MNQADDSPPDGEFDDLRDDCARPFQIDELDVRGRVVRLGQTVDKLLTRHAYPAPVSAMLGELVVTTALLAGALKFDGVMTAQAIGDGPVSMMVCDFKTPDALRAYARFDAEGVAASASEAARYGNPVPSFMGKGHLAFTVDQGTSSERYQGIVSLDGATVTECAHHYLRQSEQHNAFLRISVGRAEGENAWRAGGLMIQQFPEPQPGSGVTIDPQARAIAWEHAQVMTASARDHELIDAGLDADTLLRRLFPVEAVRVFRPLPLVHRCRCSRTRVHRVLRMFPPEEVVDMVVNGDIEVTCEFCNQRYHFTPETVERPLDN